MLTDISYNTLNISNLEDLVLTKSVFSYDDTDMFFTEKNQKYNENKSKNFSEDINDNTVCLEKNRKYSFEIKFSSKSKTIYEIENEIYLETGITFLMTTILEGYMVFYGLDLTIDKIDIIKSKIKNYGFVCSTFCI